MKVYTLKDINGFSAGGFPDLTIVDGEVEVEDEIGSRLALSFPAVFTLNKPSRSRRRRSNGEADSNEQES